MEPPERLFSDIEPEPYVMYFLERSLITRSRRASILVLKNHCQTQGFASMHELPFDSDPECRELITVCPFTFRRNDIEIRRHLQLLKRAFSRSGGQFFFVDSHNHGLQ